MTTPCGGGRQGGHKNKTPTKKPKQTPQKTDFAILDVSE